MNYMIQHCVTKRTMSLCQKGKSLYLHRGYNMHRSREAETEEIITFCKQRVKHVSKILKLMTNLHYLMQMFDSLIWL
jgi:hypothetical protein